MHIWIVHVDRFSVFRAQLTNFNSAFAILPSLNVGIPYNIQFLNVNMKQVIARKGTPKQFMFIVTRQSSRAVTFLATV